MGRVKSNYEESHKEVDGIIYKHCNQHNTFFPEEDEWLPMNEEYFYKNSNNGVDGFHTWCKECSKLKAKKWKEQNYEYYREYNDKLHNDPKNYEHDNIRCREWKKRNRDKTRSYTSNFFKRNPDKFKEYSQTRSNKNHNISKKEWKECRDYFNNSCAYCGISEKDAKEEQGQNLHKEHVCHEGANDLSNCVPSCKSCNSQKWKFALEDWYNEKNSNFTQGRLDKINKWLNEDYIEYIIENQL